MNEPNENLFEAITNDLAVHLGFQMVMGNWEESIPTDTNVLEEKNDFEKYCSLFVKERIPEDTKVDLKEVKIKITKDSSIYINVKIKVDDKEFEADNKILRLSLTADQPPSSVLDLLESGTPIRRPHARHETARHDRRSRVQRRAHDGCDPREPPGADLRRLRAPDLRQRFGGRHSRAL